MYANYLTRVDAIGVNGASVTIWASDVKFTVTNTVNLLCTKFSVLGL